jgi:hypothetical protein
VPEENVYKRKVNQIVYYKNEGIQFVYNQIDEHAFAYPHSPAEQSKNQTSGYIATYLIILFVAIDTSSIIFVSLCKKKIIPQILNLLVQIQRRWEWHTIAILSWPTP